MVRSRNPDDHPVISPGYLEHEDDRALSVRLVAYVRRLMDQDVWKPIVVGETAETSWARTEDEIVSAYLQLGIAGLHACGTCAMGSDSNAVVDERLRVRGIRGLRVVDLSVFPEMLSGNTNAPVMAMALKAADIIAEDQRHPS